MALTEEIDSERSQVATDGYAMSLGEIMSLYRDGELIINPEYQRYFRWSPSQKTKFIESLLLGIPVPPVFVFQREDGTWELVDGLQRLSTVFEFAGVLKNGDGELVTPSVLEGTKKLPSLANATWEGEDALPEPNRLDIKRARLRVEILKKESDPYSKFELFQRLNTGGSSLSEQEVRNCTLVMLNKPFFEWLKQLASLNQFEKTIIQTERAEQKQRDLELALRFIVYRNVQYNGIWDVHEYLDDSMMQLATNDAFDRDAEGRLFSDTFEFFHQALGEDSFKRWDGDKFVGPFLISAFEVLAVGASRKIEELRGMEPEDRGEWLREKAERLWTQDVFQTYSGSGVRGTRRLSNLLRFSDEYMAP